GSIGGGETESFYDEVASSAPAPGGGSVAASAGALAAALSAMVCRLSVGKKQYADVKDELSDIRDKCDVLRQELTTLIDTDKEAFNKVMEAFKTKDDKVIEDANKESSSVPLTVMKKSLEALAMIETVVNKGNENSITDAGVAGLMAMASIDGAGYNVRINLTSINDKKFVEELTGEANRIIKEGEQIAARVKKRVESKL
ncbi:MAG: cyclodeaminase/cyclohydrolase family protein, partial [Candidatus Zixiibacteriota bacterium]